MIETEPGVSQIGPTIGVVIAMAHEFNAIREVLLPDAAVRSAECADWVFGERKGINLVLVQSGIGTTNAAIGACDLIARYHPDYLLNLGTAALVNDPGQILQVGDVLVGGLHQQWDLDIGGPITTSWTEKRSFVDVLRTNRLDPDQRLLKALAATGEHYTTAVLFSGNSFFCSDEQRDLLPKMHRPVGVDMESFAVAQVCARKGVPFLCLRGISDTGQENANQDFRANVRQAAGNAARLAARLVEQLVKSAN
jgi:adenosylhomocysteine nucleosidase